MFCDLSQQTVGSLTSSLESLYSKKVTIEFAVRVDTTHTEMDRVSD
jgi:hypothetical protein